MSRIGRLPIAIPEGTQVDIEGAQVIVVGPKGKLSRSFHPDMSIRREGESLLVSRPSDSTWHRALHGTTRSILANMVEGVTKGFQKDLEISGTGYRAQIVGDKLVVQAGYSHPVEMKPLPGVSFGVEGSRISVSSIDKEIVGEMAARIRSIRVTDSYKGKGIRVSGERIRLKAGKAGKGGGKKK
ncbi:MAG: 50S ribosomal protein L6 [Chloroflexi bacterium]|nr:50S ribosomal protein L6 [Chloroflexota bacterium]